MQVVKSVIEQRSIADQVHTYIKHMILSGEFKGGERIQEERIAQALQVSRTPVREALNRLQAYGLVHMVPRRHMEVTKLESEEEGKKIALVRSRVEGLVVELLSEKHNELDCQSLSKLVEECEDALDTGDVAEIFEKDSMLHLEMARHTGNKYLYEVLERLDAKIQLYRISTCVTLEKITKDIRQHQDIFDAICQGDTEEAVRLMGQHILGLPVREGAQ